MIGSQDRAVLERGFPEKSRFPLLVKISHLSLMLYVQENVHGSCAVTCDGKG